MKQVIVVRSDLKMPKGKLAAQVAHASMMFLLKRFFDNGNGERGMLLDRNGFEWYTESGMCKVVLKADSLEKMKELHEEARCAGLEVQFVCDAGRTTFHESTITCLAIGPGDDEAVDAVTGELSLL